MNPAVPIATRPRDAGTAGPIADRPGDAGAATPVVVCPGGALDALTVAGRDNRAGAVPVTRSLVGAVALNAAAGGAGIALMGTSAWLLSRAAEQPPVLFLMIAIVTVRFLGLSRGVFRYVERLVGHDVALGAQGELRTRVYARLTRGTWIGRRGGDLLSRAVNDVDAVVDRIVRAIVPIAGGALVLTTATLCLTALSVPAGVMIGVATLVGGLVIPWLVGRATKAADRSLAPRRGELAAVVAEASGAAPDLVAYGAGGPLLARVHTADTALRVAEQRSARIAALAGAAQVLCTGGAVLGGLLAGAVAVANGTLAPVLIAVLALTPLALHEVIATLPAAVRAWHRSSAALARVDELLDKDPAAAPGSLAVSMGAEPTEAPQSLGAIGADPTARGSVVLRDLAAGWPGGPSVVNGLDLEVRRGERVALVGPSGCGKTTVAAAVLGLLPARAGSIEVGGSVGYLDQQAHLFDSTVAENLRIGDRTASDGALRDVLARVGLDLPLDRLVGEHGSAVSGGEARRIALARLLLRDYAVLILDEPTEHLDRPTADAMIDDLWRVTADTAVLVITHDPEVMARCDRIVRLS